MGLMTTPFRLRGLLMSLAGISIILLTSYYVFIEPDLTAEQSLTQKIVEYQNRAQKLETMYRSRQEDVSILTEYLRIVATQPDAPDPALHEYILDALSQETKSKMHNITMTSKLSPSSLQMPTAYQFLPHLADDPASLKPAFLISKGRRHVASIVLGVPTVKRGKQSYLLRTVEDLIKNMNVKERNETLIVIFIGETDMDYVQLVVKQLEIKFKPHIESGLIEIISPPVSYYPNFDTLRITLNDPPERVKWRSKQNLDYAFLMTYAQSKGILYVQLEDDILTKRGFITTMKNFTEEETVAKTEWLILDFCQLGFIGKMFKSSDLPWFITYFQMFYNDKPVDWLLQHLINTKVCSWEKKSKFCHQEKSKLWMHYKPSLFQHIGTTSSLNGKVQKLKDKHFGKLPTSHHHSNPPAIVRTVIAPYKMHTLQKAYDGETFFWGLVPQPGDLLEFIFNEPLELKRFFFRSGNIDHPNDRFYNATVEVLPANLDESSQMWSAYNSTKDGYLIVGNFDAEGIAMGSINPKLGQIKEIRLHVHSDTENWVILSEIRIIYNQKVSLVEKFSLIPFNYDGLNLKNILNGLSNLF